MSNSALTSRSCMGLIEFCCLLCAHHRIRHSAQPQTRDESSFLAASMTSWYRIWNASLAAAAVDAWQSLDSGHCHPWGETQTFAQRRRRRRKPSVSWYSRVTAVLQPCYDGCKLQAIVWRTLYIVANLKPPVFAGLSAKCSRKTTDYEVQKECRVFAHLDEAIFLSAYSEPTACNSHNLQSCSQCTL